MSSIHMIVEAAQACTAAPRLRRCGARVQQRPARSLHICQRASPHRPASGRAQTGRTVKTCAAAEGPAAAGTVTMPPPAGAQTPLVYSGIVFDMDGTLTVSNIDYVTMRHQTGIPVGDLFTVMESWDDGDRIKRSMDTILELEAQACADLSPMPGLLELLAYLRDNGGKVGLVTRNTTESLNSFFATIGEEWRDVFDVLLTRDNTPYVKPDKRSLLHFSEVWGMKPWELLMVGDSTEDIETANAAGTASCLIAGGGNETASAAAKAAPPRGAVPTFTVDSLSQLQRRLEERSTALGWGAYGPSYGIASLCSSDCDTLDDIDLEDYGQLSSASLLAGAPPEGLDFLDALFALGAVQASTCSFPRIDGSRFGVPPDAHPGDRVLHLACGNGALTKLLFSSGLQVIGVDSCVAEAQRRGLPAVQLQPMVLTAGALQPELAAMGQFNAAIYFRSSSGSSGSGSSSTSDSDTSDDDDATAGSGDASASASSSDDLAASWWRAESLAELQRVLKPGGKLCVQAPVEDEEAVRGALQQAGWAVLEWERADCGACRMVAASPQS